MQEFRETMSLSVKGFRTCYMCRQSVRASYKYLIRTTGIARNRQDHVPPLYCWECVREDQNLHSSYLYIGWYNRFVSDCPITACGACWTVLLRRVNEKIDTVMDSTQTQRIEKYHNLLRIRTWLLVATKLEILPEIAKYIAHFI